MAPPAERYALAFAGYHDFHPLRHLPFALLAQVSEVAYVMHLYVLFSSAYVAFVM